jgi:hypothetical protein
MRGGQDSPWLSGPPKRRKVRAPAGIRGPVGMPKTAARPIRPPAGALGPVGVGKGSRAKRAGSGGKAVAGTLPRHASTPARKSSSLSDATPAAKARAQNQPSPSSGGYGPSTPGYPPLDPQAYVDAMLAPGYQQIDTQEGRYRAQEEQQQAAISQFTAALISQLQGEPAKAAADYDTALAQSNALATQSADALRQANQNPQVQADLAAVGAPEAQKEQLAGKMSDVFTGGAGALQQTGGTIPGQFLAEEKASRLGYLRTLPFAAGAEGQRALRQSLWQDSQALQGFEDQRGQLAARAPELYQQAVSQAQAQEAAARDFELKQQALAVNQQIARAQLGLKAVGVRQGQARVNQGAARLKLQALQNDRNFQLGLQRLGIQEGGLRLRAAMSQAKLSASAKNGGYTQSQRMSLRRQAGKIADEAFNGVPSTQTDASGQTVHGTIHYTYQEAMRRMLAAGIPLTMAQAALNSFWTRPGVAQPWEQPGTTRPLVPFQQRQRKRRR